MRGEARPAARQRPRPDAKIGDGGKFHSALPAGYSGLMPANLTTLPHFSVSSTIRFANSSDVIDNSSAPMSAKRAFNLGSAMAALVSLLSRLTISGGVFFGAPMPYH